MLLGIVLRRITKGSELSRSKASQYSHTNTLFLPLGRFKREKCVCIKFILQMDKIIAYLIQPYEGTKTSKPYGIRGFEVFWRCGEAA